MLKRLPVVALAILLLAVVSYGQIYSVRDLGVLPGGLGSAGHAINAGARLQVRRAPAPTIFHMPFYGISEPGWLTSGRRPDILAVLPRG